MLHMFLFLVKISRIFLVEWSSFPWYAEKQLLDQGFGADTGAGTAIIDLRVLVTPLIQPLSAAVTEAHKLPFQCDFTAWTHIVSRLAPAVGVHI